MPIFLFQAQRVNPCKTPMKFQIYAFRGIIDGDRDAKGICSKQTPERYMAYKAFNAGLKAKNRFLIYLIACRGNGNMYLVI
jgi:hypothetical protein